MIVTFCGHRQVDNQEAVSKWLDLILPSLIEGGATMFYLGGYGAFDRLAAAAVMRQKTTYPTIEAILVLPYLDRKVDASDYDRTTYPPLEKVPPRFAIVKRNQWMVEQSDVVISAVTYKQGGVRKKPTAWAVSWRGASQKETMLSSSALTSTNPISTIILSGTPPVWTTPGNFETFSVRPVRSGG